MRRTPLMRTSGHRKEHITPAELRLELISAAGALLRRRGVASIRDMVESFRANVYRAFLILRNNSWTQGRLPNTLGSVSYFWVSRCHYIADRIHT